LDLPEAIKAGILAMVKAASPRGERMKGLKPSPVSLNAAWRSGRGGHIEKPLHRSPWHRRVYSSVIRS